MAVDYIEEISSRTYEVDDKPTIKGNVEYRGKLSSKTDSLNLVAAHASCPERGDALDGDNPGCLCRSVKIERQEVTGDDGVMFSISAEYSTESENGSGGDDGSNDPDPTEWPAELRLSFDRFEETLYRALAVPTAESEDGAVYKIDGTGPANAHHGSPHWRQGQSVVNSSGEPFDPTITTTYADPVVTFTKNITTASFSTLWSILIEYANAVNSTTFAINYRGIALSIAAGHAWLYDISSEPGFENGVQFERVTLSFRLRKDGWLRKVLDQGLRGSPIEVVFNTPGDPSSGVKSIAPIPDGNMEPITTPVNLDGGGCKREDGKPVILLFQDKPKKNFTTLPFPEIT